jgi:lauroyl/myristoyl acyltransferase
LLVDTFSVGLDTFTVVARGRTLAEALDLAAAAQPLLESRLGPGAEITSPAAWLVQGDRLERRLAGLRGLPLARAADDFERELRAAGFKLEPFAASLAALRSLGRGVDPNPPPREAWPRWMAELVKVEPGGAAVAVHVRAPRGSQGGEALAGELKQAAPGVALASVPRVGAELRSLAIADLSRSSALALALVAAVVIVSVGWRLGDALLAGLPLALGCLWAFGLWGALGGHVDLLAISTLPVLFGTGIDLGVHAVHGGRLRPEEGIGGTIRSSGLAMILVTLTTGVGFGSLGSSQVPGIRNAGTLVALGVTACLVATFAVLPALESLRRLSVALPRKNPPHAPESGRAVRRLLGPFHVTGVFWFRIHRFGVTILPSWALGVMTAVFTTFFWLVLRKIRAAVASNLEAVLGPCGFLERQRRIYRTFWNFAWCLSERYERLSTDRPFTVEAAGLETWRELMASGQGVVLVTAHLGNWEVGSMLPASRESRRIHVVREAETDPRAQRFMAGLIASRGGSLYTTHFAEDPQLGMVLLDGLRQGEVVALQGDRPRAGGRTVEATLFGRPFPLPVGTAALARAAGVPLAPVFVFRQGRLSYRCEIRPPIHVAQTANRQRDLEEALGKLAADLEAAIRREPHQWFCFRRLWSGPG